MKSLLLLTITLITITAHAITVDGVTFDDKINVVGKELVVNGVGIRKATFLKIKVYYGALYLTQKSTNSSSFLGTNDPKQIVMHFVRDVDTKDLKKTYIQAFEDGNKEAHKSQIPTLEAFLANLRDIKKGERMVITFLNDGAQLEIAGKNFTKVGDASFSQALLNMYFVNPQDTGLTNGLLGN